MAAEVRWVQVGTGCIVAWPRELLLLFNFFKLHGLEHCLRLLGPSSLAACLVMSPQRLRTDARQQQSQLLARYISTSQQLYNGCRSEISAGRHCLHHEMGLDLHGVV